MRNVNKYINVIILVFVLLFASSCTEVKVSEEEVNKDKTKIEVQTPINMYDTIENTLVSLDKIGGRLIGTKENENFVRDLKLYLKENFTEADLFIQPYTISLTDEYKVSIASQDELTTFSSMDSICKYINKGKLTESVIVTDSLYGLNNTINYIFISEDEKLIEASMEYENICLSLLTVDTVHLGQNVIKVKTDIPSVMNINKETANKLLNIKDKQSELTIEIKNKEVELENIYAVIKGNKSDNAIVVTSHIDTTTALGNNYSKGAIDNGSGISLNLDLLRKFYAEENKNTNYDLIFAFVNSEEGFLLKSSSGSMQLNDLLTQKYENILNVNIDCLGEKNIDVLNYGFDGNVNGNNISDIIISQDKDDFYLERAEYYTSDNLNFENSIYFYNFDYHGENRVIHTEKDTINEVNINNLEKISNFIYDILLELSKLDNTNLFL